jgi:hypothetical protein
MGNQKKVAYFMNKMINRTITPHKRRVYNKMLKSWLEEDMAEYQKEVKRKGIL